MEMTRKFRMASAGASERFDWRKEGGDAKHEALKEMSWLRLWMCYVGIWMEQRQMSNEPEPNRYVPVAYGGC
jgi:hypothetical protein